MKKEIGKRIQNLREDLGLSKEALAKKLGISGQFLGLIEHGKNYISIEKLKILCDMTNTTADYILFGNEPNILNETSTILSEFSDNEIRAACSTIKKLALFIKSK